MRTTALIWHELYMWHDTGRFAGAYPASLSVEPHRHYEHVDTKRRLKNLLDASELTQQLLVLAPQDASWEDLARVHTPAYLAKMQALDGGFGMADAETPIFPTAVAIARKAAGGAMVALDAVLAGRADNAYALIRPPGHHAEPDQGGGFCLFANGAVAAAAALAAGKVGRVAFVDWDVHHGNGTERCFWQDNRVLTISLHQDNWFPEGYGAAEDLGQGAGRGCNMNIPLPPGCGHGAYLYAFEQLVLPALYQFRPDVIMVSCGYDASIEDPLGRMMLHAESYRIMTQKLMHAADELCGGRMVMTHEGGYNAATVPFLGLAVIEALSGRKTGITDPFQASYECASGQPLQGHQQSHLDGLIQFFKQQHMI